MAMVVITMNVTGLTHKEFRATLDEMGVENARRLAYTSTFPIQRRPGFELSRCGTLKRDSRSSPSVD
jgi:hypothetical protein